jgi:hypothetical protein
MLVFLDRGQGKLLPRYVQVGRSFTTFDGQQEESYYQVINGVKEGDRIVDSANFLIDAESQVQGALKDWEGEQQPSATPGVNQISPPQGSDFGSLVKVLLDSYKGMQGILAESEFPKVSAEAQDLQKQVHLLLEIEPPSKPDRYQNLVGKLHSSADEFTPDNIEQARIDFGQFSAALIAFLREFMPQLDDRLYTIECPVWKKSPAVWLQDSTQVKNPFLGPDMPSCGTVQGEIHAQG